ncbi:PREDICTED: uncharacterized protein LOC108364160 isoform X2 [Rhagoletis zephyria]|uniref:uncharacterized protein LOC108364160 isoform X1 n=1 Tax=Rhagoletis zephyria TaxID=28612 RepID=UPI000811A545|nr:PREDICTED: uncharacterized protein LOC108364160 isoform X1 [Rhagoletis zephyria]XP_017473240.1 PREDICTED: uncharacterized protein LOC108364160 isoform X2 [Rhagoletis zephyria]
MSVSLTTEQFERLIRAVHTTNDRTGTFSTCNARYNGERNPSKVEEFIAAISTFKTVEKINDVDAIKGMPMLLEGDAAEWWRGVKDEFADFADVVRRLRESFSPPKPAWRIYSEIFDIKQNKTEPTDTFIRKKRALFSQLQNVPAEAEQLDMLFGMLHAQIRKRVSRQKVSSYEQLLSEAREAEHFVSERKTVNCEHVPKSASVAEVALRCNFCRKKGHTLENCFKRQKAKAAEAQSAAIAQAVAVKPKFACYGCNAPGFTRVNCTTCRNKNQPAGDFANFNNLTARGIERDIPVVNVHLFGVPGQVFFDFGARTSVASANSKSVMDFKGCKYRNVKCEITLADGSTSTQACLSTVCEILIGGRRLNIEFIILPNACGNRTLIGMDFLEQAGIVLNMGQRYWYFESDPMQHFDFAPALPLKLNFIETVKVSSTRPKRVAEEEPEREVDRSKMYMSEFESYGPEFSDNEYSPHSVQAIFKDALPADAVTPERKLLPSLFNGLIYNIGNYDDSDFTRLYSIDFKLVKPSDGNGLNQEQKRQLDSVL